MSRPPKRSGGGSRSQGSGRPAGRRSGGKPAGGRSGGGPGGRGSGGRAGGAGPPSRSSAAGKGLGGRQVEGRQAVRELLMAQRRRVHEIWMSAELEGDPAVADIAEIAAAQRVPVTYVGRAKLDKEARSEAPQGVVAFAAELPEADLGELIRGDAGAAPFLVAVDGVTDPGNLGAIIRSCDGAGVTGVLLPRHRAVHVTPTVAKASAGAIEHVAIALVPGLPATLKQLTGRGIWNVGLDDGAERSLFDLDDLATEPICLVLGAEGSGLARLTSERCDVLVSIPMAGRIESLNVSAAAALATYEIARARRAR